MSIPNLNKILAAQERQRSSGQGEAPQGEDNNDEVVKILKLVFEYMKSTNNDMHEVLNEVLKNQEQIKKRLKALEDKNE